MKEVNIIPTVFAHNKKEFNERFHKVIKISKDIQIDFMDGKFVKAKSMPLSAVPNLKNYNNSFEAHLMVENPEKWIKKVAEKGFERVIFHIESTKNEEAEEMIRQSEKNNLKPFIAINPETNINRILLLVKRGIIRNILLLGVRPGKEHQPLNKSIPKRILLLKKVNPNLFIQIDGGVNDKTAPLLKKANALNSGSFISDSPNPKKALAFLIKKANS